MPTYRDQGSVFVQDLIEMQKQFYNSEYEFSQFNEIIPYARNPLNIYSPRLVNLSLYLGPQILGMFEIIRQQFGINCNDKFPAYYDAINRNGLLSSQGFMLADLQTTYHPFTDNNPIWWQAYNTIKHNMPVGIFQATYENVVNMIGALFILHHIADLKQRDLNSVLQSTDVSDNSNWLVVNTIGQYIYYRTPTAISSSLYEGFISNMIRMEKRFLPHLKNHNITPNYNI